MNFEDFKQNYRATFNEELRAEGVWASWIDGLDNERAMKDAFSYLEEIFVAKRSTPYPMKAPGLSEFRNCYFRACKDIRRSEQKLCRSECSQCHGDSGLWIVIHRQSKRVLHPGRPEPYPAIELGVFSAPCPNSSASNVCYNGWRITDPRYLVDEFIALCNAKFQFEVYGKKVEQPERMELGTMKHRCPKCQNEMLLDAPPDDLKPEWKNNLLALLANIVCEDCRQY